MKKIIEVYDKANEYVLDLTGTRTQYNISNIENYVIDVLLTALKGTRYLEEDPVKELLELYWELLPYINNHIDLTSFYIKKRRRSDENKKGRYFKVLQIRQQHL